MKRPGHLIGIGFAMLAAGWLVALLLTMGYLPPGFLTGLVSYGIGFAGLLVGAFGLTVVGARKRRNRPSGQTTNTPRQ